LQRERTAPAATGGGGGGGGGGGSPIIFSLFKSGEK